MVDEHAGELVADRLVQQHRGDRGIDAAGESADHLALAHLGADLLDRLILEGAHGPVAGAARDLAHEIAQERRAVRGVHHFEMELGRVEFALRRRRSWRSARSARSRRCGSPGGSSVTRSPWLIHTGYFSPTAQIPSNRTHSEVISTSARPNSP